MKIRAYKVEHDLGFAPNPFFGVCTLACCRAVVRAKAEEGDLILGLGTVATGTLGKLTYWMEVDELSDFNRYFNDERFQRKKPNVRGAKRRRYGDNIYWRDNEGEPLQQLDSFHAHPVAAERQLNIDDDTGVTENVLIGRRFGYYGGAGPEIPAEFELLHRPLMRYRCNFPEPERSAIEEWIRSLDIGYHGDPAGWGKLKVT